MVDLRTPWLRQLGGAIVDDPVVFALYFRATHEQCFGVRNHYGSVSCGNREHDVVSLMGDMYHADITRIIYAIPLGSGKCNVSRTMYDWTDN
jgi:hypothetical protein